MRLPSRASRGLSGSHPGEPVNDTDLVPRRKWWSLDEAAYQLDTTRMQLYRWEAQGLLNFTR